MYSNTHTITMGGVGIGSIDISFMNFRVVLLYVLWCNNYPNALISKLEQAGEFDARLIEKYSLCSWVILNVFLSAISNNHFAPGIFLNPIPFSFLGRQILFILGKLAIILLIFLTVGTITVPPLPLWLTWDFLGVWRH